MQAATAPRRGRQPATVGGGQPPAAVAWRRGDDRAPSGVRGDRVPARPGGPVPVVSSSSSVPRARAEPPWPKRPPDSAGGAGFDVARARVTGAGFGLLAWT